MPHTTTPATDVHAGPTWRIASPRGRLVTIEGVWGAGKTTAAQLVGARLRRAGFTVQVIHYGGEPGSIGRLSAFLERSPLRARTGLGGYAMPHHSTIDVLLRLCREAHHHVSCFRPALAAADVVLVDHGVYSKLAWALAVLTETAPDTDPARTLQHLRAVVAPWFCEPDVPVYLDTPWPLARERAIARGRGGGDPAAIERLLFLPRYTAAYRQVLAGHKDQVARVRVGLRAAGDVAEEITGRLLGVLRAAPLSATAPGGR
ncbi:dTMP kinase [Micromonospora nigra]|uniref:Thymidylate kinase n=2 Tax=Micromonospora nigra TaxID=145857 RepID=A0A1C6R7T1_9ACTN|nr:hypothetical protein [Micromonospora nigra]SCL13104.1 dTMP kinase [Micromonospora nigra]